MTASNAATPAAWVVCVDDTTVEGATVLMETPAGLRLAPAGQAWYAVPSGGLGRPAAWSRLPRRVLGAVVGRLTALGPPPAPVRPEPRLPHLAWTVAECCCTAVLLAGLVAEWVALAT